MHSLRLAQAGDVYENHASGISRIRTSSCHYDGSRLLREVQTHLPAREIDFLQPRSADSRKAVEGLLREKGFVGRREDFHPARFVALSAAHYSFP